MYLFITTKDVEWVQDNARNVSQDATSTTFKWRLQHNTSESPPPPWLLLSLPPLLFILLLSLPSTIVLFAYFCRHVDRGSRP
jgi:hypothetical protein